MGGESHPRGPGGSDRVTERWEIGQNQEGGAAELPEYMEEQSQEQNNTISLNRTNESSSTGQQSLPPPNTPYQISHLPFPAPLAHKNKKNPSSPCHSTFLLTVLKRKSQKQICSLRMLG